MGRSRQLLENPTSLPTSLSTEIPFTISPAPVSIPDEPIEAVPTTEISSEATQSNPIITSKPVFRSQFVTSGQIRNAVNELINEYPDLVGYLRNSAVDSYQNLSNFGLIPPTPTVTLSNSPPVIADITVSQQTVSTGQQMLLTARAMNLDGEPLVYLWSADRGSVPVGSRSSTVQYTAPQQGGIDIITVVVSDGKNTTSETISIAVLEEPILTPSVIAANPTSLIPTTTPSPVPTTLVSTATPLSTATTTPTPTPLGGGQGRIAFDSIQNGDLGNIYVADIDGSNLIRLTNSNATEDRQDWSPDGTQIVFRSYRDGNYEIYVMNADGSEQRRLTFNEASDDYPRWSPSGGKIAFHSNRDGDWDIYVMDADGSNMAQLTNNDYSDWFPTWSPDGAQIAFSSQRDGNLDIYVMDALGSEESRLTNTALANEFVSDWSPDGEQLAFFREQDDLRQIYIMDTNTFEEVLITPMNSDSIYPSWSPDGKQIAFQNNRDGVWSIYIMDMDTRITHFVIGMESFSPKWQP